VVAKHKKEPRWIFVVRVIILVLLALALIGGVLLAPVIAAFGEERTSQSHTQIQTQPLAQTQPQASPQAQLQLQAQPQLQAQAQAQYPAQPHTQAQEQPLSYQQLVGEASGLSENQQPEEDVNAPSDENSAQNPVVAATSAQELIDSKPLSAYSNITDDIPTISAREAALGTSNGRVLYERSADMPVPMASTTKIMTAVVALEALGQRANGLQTPMTVTVGAANADGSEAGLQAEMVLPFRDVLDCLMIPSGNDAAIVIAENISGTEAKFTQLMNAKAAELGMTSTHYADASGLSVENHYTTAKDYLKLTQYAMRIPVFREVVATEYKEIIVGDTKLELYSTDKLWQVLETGTVLGVKTGYTEESGYCFVGAAIYGDIELYSIVFGEEEEMQRFIDSALLLEWGFRHWRTIELLNPAQKVADVALLSWLDKRVEAYVAEPVMVQLLDLHGDIRQEITINEPSGEVVSGQVIGSVVWTQGGEALATASLVSDRLVSAPDFFEGIGIGWTRFWSGIFGGSNDHAQSEVLLKESLPVPAAN
jgi:D-alanyl-D-alanine carboxypeptidase (penicillin-binding protein 5/6)